MTLMHNFRDLGGLTTNCERKIKNGLLYRTGNVAHWTEAEAKYLVHDLGVKTYIDFRKPKELKIFGEPKVLMDHGVEWINLSIDTDDPEFQAKERPMPEDWIRLYKLLFDKNKSSWTEFVELVADAKSPVMYGCLFGKDRTGIATSFLLSLLDVHDELISKDYAKTTDHIKPLSEMFQPLFNDQGLTDEEAFHHYARSPEEVMYAFLEYIRTHPENSEVGHYIESIKELHQEKLKGRLLVKKESK